MKIFWLLIALISIATIVLFATDGRSSESARVVQASTQPVVAAESARPRTTQDATATAEPAPAEPAPVQEAPALDPVLEPAATPIAADEASTPTDTIQSTTPPETTERADATPPAPAYSAADTNDDSPQPELAQSAREVSIEDLLSLLESSPPAPTDAFEARAEEAAGPGPTTEVVAAEQPSPTEETMPSRPAQDITLTGEGTEQSPYVIEWDLLTSARNTFDPKNGKSEIPDLVEALDGKWVSLSGYTLFPLANPKPREVLLMLNAWDGCCIGVPPSPYDAIEVTLASSVGEERFAQEGRVVGKLKVDPYMVGDWLIGLYTINGASFDAAGG